MRWRWLTRRQHLCASVPICGSFQRGATMPDHILGYCGGLSALAGVFGASLGGRLRSAGQRPFALPGDKPHYARDRAVDVQHIKLEISIDPAAKRIEGACHTTFVPINDGLA